MGRMRISLIWFFVGISLIGSGVGMYGRHQKSRKTYVTKTVRIKLNVVCAAWIEDGWGRQQLTYLVVAPLGDKLISGCANWRSQTPSRGSAHDEGLDLDRQCFHFLGKRVAHSDDARVWMYRTTDQTIGELDPGMRYADFTTKDFDGLATSSLWLEKLGPAAQKESDAWLAMIKRKK
jgi:hypothetical protein